MFYDRSLPAHYVPPVSASNARPYVWAYRVLGFRWAGRVRSAFRE
ncbi:hypothetical protein [Rubrivirga sp. S365]|nr:hypothetical protein [Rubrivirga sp. S365]